MRSDLGIGSGVGSRTGFVEGRFLVCPYSERKADLMLLYVGERIVMPRTGVKRDYYMI